MIDWVWFDYNGVVIADARLCHKADSAVIIHFGGMPPSFKLYQDTVNIPARDFYAQYGSSTGEMDVRNNEVGQVFTQHYEPLADKCRTRRGVRETLKFLKAHKIKAGIISNHPQWAIEKQLKRLKLEKYFRVVLGNASQTTSMFERNKLLRLKQYLAANNADPKKCLIIGDSPEEIEIGRTLGMVAVAIKDGYYATWRLRQARPNFRVIANVINLIKVIEFCNEK